MNDKQDLIQLTELLKPHAAILTELYSQSIAFLRLALEARRTTLTRDGELVDLGPDLRVRTTAMKMVANICTRGKQPFDEPLPEYTVLWHEWERLLEDQERQEQEKAQAASPKRQRNQTDVHKN